MCKMSSRLLGNLCWVALETCNFLTGSHLELQQMVMQALEEHGKRLCLALVFQCSLKPVSLRLGPASQPYPVAATAYLSAHRPGRITVLACL